MCSWRSALCGAASVLDKDVDIGVRSRQAGSLVRWGAQVDSHDPLHRFDGTDAAIAELQALIAEASQAPERDTGLLVRLQRDLVVALRDRERWADALAAAEALRAGGDILPAYVRHAEADALLALRRPGDARRAYQEVLTADATDRDARIGRFYAEIEEEDYTAAFASADALAAEGTAMRRVGRNPVPQPNDDWLDGQVLAAQARRYADMPAEAWRRLKPLADAAPGSAILRAELGETAAARGWPRRAAGRGALRKRC